VACDQGDWAAAAARLAASLPVWQATGTWETAAEWLAGVATLAAARGAPERAAGRALSHKQAVTEAMAVLAAVAGAPAADPPGAGGGAG
jgi:hypothetical protein